MLDYEPVISNLSHILLFLPNDKIMLKCKKVHRIKCSCFVLELPMCDQKIFSPHNINILLSSKQVLNKNREKYQPHERRLFGLINTKLSKQTKWEMYGRQKNSYGSLVSGRVNTKLTIYHKCILTEFEDICASGFRSREF